MKATKARLATVLEAIPNVGPSIARDLRSIGIKQPRDLIGGNPYSLYRILCDKTRTRQGPCVLDTFRVSNSAFGSIAAQPFRELAVKAKLAKINFQTESIHIEAACCPHFARDKH